MAKMYISPFELNMGELPSEEILAMQGDTLSRYVRFRLSGGIKKIDLTGCSARFTALKPDGKRIFNDAEIVDPVNAIVDVELTSQTLAVPGAVKGEVLISKDGARLSSFPFIVRVIRTVQDDEAIISESEINALDHLIQKIYEAADKVDNCQEIIDTTGKKYLNEMEVLRQDVVNLHDKIYSDPNVQAMANILELMEKWKEAEANRVKEEDYRTRQEANRTLAESERVKDEDKRTKQETIRQENEIVRIENEQHRTAKEEERKNAETERISNETKRGEEETKREDNEKARIAQEITRIEQENARKIQEKDRVDKEKQRQESETERIDNELTRQTNEQGRVTAELSRVENESKREVGETTRKESMDKIMEDWEKLKEELHNLEGGGDMMKAVYDTNKSGVVDDAEKLGGKTPDEYLQKNAGTTWDDINKYKEVIAGSRTEVLKLNKPGTNSKVQIVSFNKNTDILEEAIVRLGVSELKDGGTNIDNLNTPGIYLLKNMENAPDIPPAGQRNYIVRVYAATNKLDLYYHVESLGTGKQYMYRFEGGYSEIPCTSPVQPTDLYIDMHKGSDDNDGSTASKAVETWACAYSRIPKILTKPLTIRFISIPSDTQVAFSNFTYEGGDDDSTKLIIHGYNHVIKKLSFLNCNLSGYQYGINIADLSASEIILEGSSASHIYKCQTDVIVAQDCYTYCEECLNKQYKSIRHAYMNVINHLTPPFSLGTYGCFADWGGYIYVQGNKPTGTSGDKYEAHGGKVEIIE